MSSGIHRAVAGTHQRSRFRNSDNLSATDTTLSRLALGGLAWRPSPRLPPLSIERMRGIDRIAVVADRRAVASVLERRLQAIVARFAERANRAKQEGVVIAAMRRVMVGDRRRRDAALRPA